MGWLMHCLAVNGDVEGSIAVVLGALLVLICVAMVDCSLYVHNDTSTRVSSVFL